MAQDITIRFLSRASSFDELIQLTSKEQTLLTSAKKCIQKGEEKIRASIIPNITRYSLRNLFLLSYHCEELRTICNRSDLQDEWKKQFVDLRWQASEDPLHTDFDHLIGAYLASKYRQSLSSLGPEHPDTQRLLTEARNRGILPEETLPTASNDNNLEQSSGHENEISSRYT